MADGIDVFGARLKEMRTKKNLTQKDLAEKLDVSVNTIVSYERSQKSASLDIGKRIAEFFGVSLDWLCGLDRNANENRQVTYSDVIRAMIDLDKQAAFEIVRGEFWSNPDDEYDNEKVSGHVLYYSGSCDDTIESFLSDWSKMRALLKAKTISRALYDLWLEQQLSDHEKKLGSNARKTTLSTIGRAEDEPPF